VQPIVTELLFHRRRRGVTAGWAGWLASRKTS